MFLKIIKINSCMKIYEILANLRNLSAKQFLVMSQFNIWKLVNKIVRQTFCKFEGFCSLKSCERSSKSGQK